MCVCVWRGRESRVNQGIKNLHKVLRKSVRSTSHTFERQITLLLLILILSHEALTDFTPEHIIMRVRSGQIRVFNVHIQSKLFVMGTGTGLRRILCLGQENNEGY